MLVDRYDALNFFTGYEFLGVIFKPHLSKEKLGTGKPVAFRGFPYDNQLDRKHSVSLMISPFDFYFRVYVRIRECGLGSSPKVISVYSNFSRFGAAYHALLLPSAFPLFPWLQ